MKFAGILAVALAFAACDEDFTDWANPQTHPQPDSIEAALNIEAVPTGVVDKEQAPESIGLVRIASTENIRPAGDDSIHLTALRINGQASVPFTEHDGTLSVSAASLDSAVQVAYKSKAHAERQLALTVEASVRDAGGEALALKSNEATVAYLPGATPAAESAYYVLGDFCGWSAETAMPMQSKGNGVFELEFEAAGDAWYKIFPGSAITTDVDWGAAMGSAVDGDTSAEGFVEWSNAQALKVGEGRWRLTIDVENWRFTVKAVADELYMTGSAFGNWSTWHQLVPVWGESGHYWTLVYLSAGDEFKFAPQAGWGNDFGAGQLTMTDNAGAQLSGTDNVVVGNAGWYLLYVDAVNKTLETFSPDVYLIGETAGSWDLLPENRFEVPADGTGEFVSPAFVATNEIRVCVHPKESLDWWKTEFIVLDGQIAYRGAGDDQQRVTGAQGKRLYLNFGAGTGEVR